MAKCVIGGTEYDVPELNFIALERAWPFIEASMLADPNMEPMKGPSAGISVIAAGICESEGFDRLKFGIPIEPFLTDQDVFDMVVIFLKKKLKASEISNVSACLNQITKEAGLDEKDPPPPPAQGDLEKLSTGTAPGSSPSLSQPVSKGEAGEP